MTSGHHFQRIIENDEASKRAANTDAPADPPETLADLLDHMGTVRFEITPNGTRMNIPAIRLTDDCVVYPRGYTGPRLPDDTH
jgi:hypothetical protein